MAFYCFALVVSLLLLTTPSSSATQRKLSALVQEQPSTVLKYHNGVLLKGTFTVNLIWYGRFSLIQRAILVDFILSLGTVTKSKPSVSSWWKTTEKYQKGSSNLVLGEQFLTEEYSLGKYLKSKDLITLAQTFDQKNAINVIFTSENVAVEGFCMSRCGTHGSARGKSGNKFAYGWVGNSVSQCPGQCAWPFHQPIYGPQSPPLRSPNGDVGVDGMIINLATVLAGTVTNPFRNGFFQGSVNAPLEAVSACTGLFGKGAYPGYPGEVLVDRNGASYNALGVNGRKYLIPAMWDPRTSTCSTLV